MAQKRIIGPSGSTIGFVELPSGQFSIPRLLAATSPTALKLITNYFGAIYIIDDEKISPKLKAYFSLFEYNGVKYGFRGDYPSPIHIFNKDALWDELIRHDTEYTLHEEPEKTIRRTNVSLTYRGAASPTAIINKRTRYFSECFEEIPSIAMSYVKDNQSSLIHYMVDRDKIRANTSSMNGCFNLGLFKDINDRQRIPKHFPVDFAKSLYKKFRAKKVLDPSAGWADRMIGAAAAGVEEYVGVDPNSKLRGMYWSINQFLATKSKTNIRTIEDGFLEAVVPEGYFDTILTSPPYWNYEIYSEDEKQSIKKHQVVNTWVDDFMKPYLYKCARCLTADGVLILRMSDTSAGVYMAELIDYITKNTDMKLQGVIAVKYSEDYTFVFSKPEWVPVTIEEFIPVPQENSIQNMVEKEYFKYIVGGRAYNTYIYYRKEFNPINLIGLAPEIVIVKKNVSKETYEAEKAGATVIITPDPASVAYEIAMKGDAFVIPPFSVKAGQEEYQRIVLALAAKYIPKDFDGTVHVSNEETLKVLQEQYKAVKYKPNIEIKATDLIWY